jgi:hypothetical protein
MKIQIEKIGADFKVLIPALICSENESIIISPEDIKQMRDWAEECQWADDCEIADFSDAEVIRGVNRFYEGGLIQFQRDSGKLV